MLENDALGLDDSWEMHVTVSVTVSPVSLDC